MHITVSWDIYATGQKLDELNNEMKEALQGYSWVRPLKSTYIVKINSNEERTELKNALVKIIAKSDKKIHLLISPPMDGGVYTGWLPKGLWEKINQRTK